MELGRDFYARIVESIQVGLYFVDRDRTIRYWNKAAETISGYSAAEVVGKSCADNLLTHVDSDGNSLCMGRCPLAATIGDGERRDAEVFMHHKGGHRVPVSVRTDSITDEKGNVIGGVEIFSDISSAKAIEERIQELEELALLDGLTKLANRSCTERELYICIEERERLAIPFGVLFMDIDHFKQFNDTYGHDVGDRVLRFVADTMVRNSRPFDLFGRWGGEEFIGIIRNVSHGQLERIGNKTRVLVENSYISAENDRLHVTISIGATPVGAGDTVDTLVKRADTLLYESKRTGRNRLTMG